eukprot:TRINITY_DN70556_c0_g1_i1.p1 TRINITY_DN70556_c0_g1~~TRINITY_DN70556_c0_g1_i1.p1  ORF type:complete len:254 (+),score=27.97 TRINITY_DN70556_c0_g1_i1:55-762(+)
MAYQQRLPSTASLHSTYSYSPIGKANGQSLHDVHSRSMMLLGCGLCLTVTMFLIGFSYIWFSTTIPQVCPVGFIFYFQALGFSNIVLALLIAAGTFLMKGMLLSASHAAQIQRIEDESNTYSLASTQQSEDRMAHKAEFQEHALHYGGGMTAVLVLQYLVMLFQAALGIYGIYLIWKTYRDDVGYMCGNSVTVFWILLAVHFCQNCCNIGKSYKGYQHHPRSSFNTGDEDDEESE